MAASNFQALSADDWLGRHETSTVYPLLVYTCEIVLVRERINRTVEEIKSLKNGTALWQIDNYEKMKKEHSTMFSLQFYTSENGFKMRIKIDFKYGDIFPSIEHLSGEFDLSLPPLIHFRATLSILDQSGRSEKRDRVILFEPRFGDDAKACLENNYFSWSILSETGDKEIYLKKDKLYIKAEMEPLISLFHNYFSNDGILVWNIDNYERTKQEAIKGINNSIYSDYFYSSQRGFRMKARAAFKNGYIHFYLLFLVGEFDNKLPFFFSHRCTFSLLDQKRIFFRRNVVFYSSS